MKKNFKSGLIVLIVMLVVVTGLSVFSALGPGSKIRVTVKTKGPKTSEQSTVKTSPDFDKKEAKSYKKDFIAALYIEGAIAEANNDYNQEWLMSTIQELKEDKHNSALAIFINSPGGTVYQADEVYLALQDYRTTGRPIYVYQGSMAASGGYYISCAADKIYANRNTLTGCIGVLMGTTFDLTGLFEGLGIKSETIHSGKNKNMMNYNEPFTDEQREIMQSMCDECYDQFVGIVAKSRGMQFEKAQELSDGRLYTANQALENGLIDHIDSWDNMLKDLSENELKKPGIKVNTYKYQKKSSFMDMMMGKAKELSNAKAAATLGLPVSVIEDMNSQSMVPMYLYK